MLHGTYAFDVDWLPGSGTSYDSLPAPDGPVEVDISRGRQNELALVQQGTARVVLSDPAGVYDPNNASSPLVSAGYLKMMRFFQMTVTPTAGSPTPLFSGFLTRIQHNARLGERQTAFEVTDGFEILNLATPVIGETGPVPAGTAIDLVLTGAGVPTGGTYRDLDAGFYLSGFSADGSQTALSLITSIQTVDRGMFFYSAAGKYTYRDRSYLTGRRTALRIWTTALVEASAPEQSVYDIINKQTVTRPPSGVPQTVSDATSVGVYQERSGADISSALLQSDVDAYALAQWVVYRRKDPAMPARTMRAPGMTLAQVQMQTACELGDSLTLTGLGAVTSARIEGIRHRISRAAGHSTEYAVTLWTANGFTVDTSTVDGPDVIVY